MTDLSYQIYVGVDWGTEEHRVVILDAERRVLHDRRVRQEAMALETFATWLSDLVGGRVDTVAVARRRRAAPWSRRSWRAASTCSPSIRNSSIAFGTALRSPAPRMIAGTPTSSAMPWPPIDPPFAGSHPRTRGSSSCGSSLVSMTTSSRSWAD